MLISTPAIGFPTQIPPPLSVIWLVANSSLLAIFVSGRDSVAPYDVSTGTPLLSN